MNASPSLIADGDYNHENATKFSFAECESVVGREATVTLSGHIDGAGGSDAGPFVLFQPDERFGFGDFRFGIDLDALSVPGLWTCEACGIPQDGAHGPNTICPYGLVAAIDAGFITALEACKRLEHPS